MRRSSVGDRVEHKGRVRLLGGIDVRAALRAIGEVTGEAIDDAVLAEIFSRFCIGK